MSENKESKNGGQAIKVEGMKWDDNQITSAKKWRIVVISDTHNDHKLIRDIPDGDILIHCGDFSHKNDWKNLSEKEIPSTVIEFNKFIGKFPHKHKIVIAGNHEIGFNDLSVSQIQIVLSNCTYLQDSAVVIEGVKIYGTPWTKSRHMAFSCPSDDLVDKWQNIPSDTDILITHLPPFNVFDLAWVGSESSKAPKDTCPVCDKMHPTKSHWGCKNLLLRSMEVKPKVHLFGHVHDCPGYVQLEDITFVNAACALTSKAHYFDFFPDQCKQKQKK